MAIRDSQLDMARDNKLEMARDNKLEIAYRNSKLEIELYIIRDSYTERQRQQQIDRDRETTTPYVMQG